MEHWQPLTGGQPSLECACFIAAVHILSIFYALIIIIFGMGLFHSSCTHFEYLLYIIIMKCAWFIASSRHYLDCWYCGDQQIEVNMMILITSIITSLINTSLLGRGNLFCQFMFMLDFFSLTTCLLGRPDERRLLLPQRILQTRWSDDNC